MNFLACTSSGGAVLPVLRQSYCGVFTGVPSLAHLQDTILHKNSLAPQPLVFSLWCKLQDSFFFLLERLRCQWTYVFLSVMWILPEQDCDWPNMMKMLNGSFETSCCPFNRYIPLASFKPNRRDHIILFLLLFSWCKHWTQGFKSPRQMLCHCASPNSLISKALFYKITSIWYYGAVIE